MAKARGFRLGRRIVKVFGCLVNRRNRTRGIYCQRMGESSCCAGRAVSKLCRWGRSLIRSSLGIGAGNGIRFGNWNTGYIRMGREETMIEQEKVNNNNKEEVVMSVPKGHLAVYVGEKDDDACRVVVPVIYFNHPLFAELLREAEQVYGFHHQGGIQIPCQKSKFENVKMRIATANGGGDKINSIFSRSRRSRSWRQFLVANGGGSVHLDH